MISKTGAIYFKTGSADLDQESAPLLNSVADIANRCPSVKIDVEGHTDNVGTKSANQQLSEARAKSVVDYLARKGVSAARIQSAGYGDTRPDAAERHGREQGQEPAHRVQGQEGLAGAQHFIHQTDRAGIRAPAEKAMNRRETLQFLLGAAALASPAGIGGRGAALAQPKTGPFTLPTLGYSYEALEPNIDATTMRIHHGNHHAAYVNNLNGLAERWPDLATKPIEEILSNLSIAPEELRTAVRNNLGGHWNHTYFWNLMTPGGARLPTEDVKAALDGAFGDVDKMKAAVKQAGLARFGSGWAWLAVGKDKKLTVFSTANQDTPQMDVGAKPILSIDVWEHAYYLKHQSKRGDYIDIWWNTLNWDKVAANYRRAMA